MNDLRLLSRRRLALAAACCVIAAGLAVPAIVPATAVAQGQQSAREATRTYSGITQPSKQFELALPNLGRVDEVQVKTGDSVEAGQVLLRQSDDAEQARLKELEIDADIATRVETARQRAELARVQEQRQKNLVDAGGGNPLEYEEARINRIVAEAQIAEEEREGTAAQARIEQLQVTLAEKQMTSPAKAVVRSLEAQVGEMHGPQTPVVELVVIDPLKVQVLNMPPSIVSTLSRGQEVEVRYAGGDDWKKAKVTFIDPFPEQVALNEHAIELEMPNPEGMPAGFDVEVRVAPAAGDAQADAGQ